MRQDTRLLATLSSSTILICIFACSQPDNPNIESTIGDLDAPIEEWEPAPISMATGSRYDLRAIEGFKIQNAIPEDARVQVVFQSDGEAEKLVLSSPDEELDTDVELEISSDTARGSTNVELSIKRPDEFRLLVDEDPGSALDGPILFLEDSFTLTYDLLLEGTPLAGYNFEPYAALEGVTLTSSTRERQNSAITTSTQRVLEFEVASMESSLVLASEKGWIGDLELERVDAQRIDDIRWIDVDPYNSEPGEALPPELPCCEVIDKDAPFVSVDDGFAPISLRALSGTSPVHGVTFIVANKTPELCSVSAGLLNEAEERTEDGKLIVEGSVFEHIIVNRLSTDNEAAEGPCVIEAALEADPLITSSLTVEFTQPEE
jgi:hypothetical protein